MQGSEIRVQLYLELKVCSTYLNPTIIMNSST